MDCGWESPRAPSVRLLFRDARVTPALLEFLEDIRVGRISGRVLLAGGPDLNEDEIEEVELWAREKEEGSDISESRMGLAHPTSLCLSFVLREGAFSLLLFGGIREGEQGCPTLTVQAGPG